MGRRWGKLRGIGSSGKGIIPSFGSRGGSSASIVFTQAAAVNRQPIAIVKITNTFANVFIPSVCGKEKRIYLPFSKKHGIILS